MKPAPRIPFSPKVVAVAGPHLRYELMAQGVNRLTATVPTMAIVGTNTTYKGWRRGQRYGTIVCGLERGRVIDLLPEGSSETVAAWLRRHPGVEVVAHDRGGA